ncbi:MAG: discoidin domain-containing protein [Mobilitalea sp.]
MKIIKILRRFVIVLLFIAIIALAVYKQKSIVEPPQDIPAANVTVNEARDQTEAEEHPAFIKEEYVAVLPEGTNVAVGKSIEANSFTDVYNAAKANDGSTDGASYWEGTNEYPNTLTVDLENPTKINAVRIALNPLAIWGKRTQTIAVKISADGTTFTDLVGTTQYIFDPDTGNEVQLTFAETEARFVQLEITENSGAGGGQVAEFEVYSKN